MVPISTTWQPKQVVTILVVNADDFDNFLVDNQKVVLLTTHLKTFRQPYVLCVYSALGFAYLGWTHYEYFPSRYLIPSHFFIVRNLLKSRRLWSQPEEVGFCVICMLSARMRTFSQSVNGITGCRIFRTGRCLQNVNVKIHRWWNVVEMCFRGPKVWRV